MSDSLGSSSMAMNTQRKIELPSRWSLLEEKHFPLFVSFDEVGPVPSFQLSDLNPFRELTRSRSPFPVQLSSLLEVDLVPLGIRSRQTLIDFRVFELAYFPHFDEDLVEGLDPVMVWNEMLGVIK